MTYTLKRLDEAPAYLLSFTSDFDMQVDMKPLNEEFLTKLDNDVADNVSIIAEIDSIDLSLSKIMVGTKSTLDSGFNPNQHPKVFQTIVITDNGILKMSMGGLGKLGLLKDAQVVANLDDAIRIAQQV